MSSITPSQQLNEQQQAVATFTKEFLDAVAAVAQMKIELLDKIKNDIATAKAELSTEFFKQCPVGSFISLATPVVPAGFLECNGALVSRETFAELFAVISTTFSGGDGFTTFGLPDARGVFRRGWDKGRGLDSGRVFGSYQADEFKSHTHEIDTYQGETGSAVANTGLYSGPWGIQTATAGGVETRPKNITEFVCIKY